MRLTLIKLAGFKSFVEATTIRTPGQLVGIVGPNGCGKSNVIDAVRWVLGESKASALRGECMQDVIFNGAGERKPLSRASVELVFDNSLGRAAGQWSSYAELSIKRVLTRDGDSTYYINQTPVRRRDIIDLFLGTGLGPRAYAIIEQGMVARLIEAKPEEMRVYLEEAAGISKYKERRKETEARLVDARENLLRVEDIQRELIVQLEKLTGQATIAQQYQRLQQDLTIKNQLFYWGKQREAEANRQKYSVERARYESEYEQAVAQLRALEARLEEARQKQNGVQEALNGCQAAYYQASAEVNRLEQSIRVQQEQYQRLQGELQQLVRQQEDISQQCAMIQGDLSTNQSEQIAHKQAVDTTALAELASRNALPGCEQELHSWREQFAKVQKQVVGIEQALQLEEAHRAHAQKTQQQWQAKQIRLEQEKKHLTLSQSQFSVGMEESGEPLQERLQEAQDILGQIKEALPEMESKVNQSEAALNEAKANLEKVTRSHTELKAQHAALSGLQSRLQKPEETQWLAKQGLTAEKPLWQLFSVKTGWEDAVEAVLRERLNARRIPDLQATLSWSELPRGGVVYQQLLPEIFADTAVASIGSPPAPALPSLFSKLQPIDDRAIAALLQHWLQQVYAAESLAIALQQQKNLQPSTSIVTRDGHWISLATIRFFAPAENIHGALVRQRELDQLADQLVLQSARLQAAQAEVTDLEDQLRAGRQDRQLCTQRLAEQQRLCHDLELKFLQFEQTQKNLLQRKIQLDQELQELQGYLAQESDQIAQTSAKIAELVEKHGLYLGEREQVRHLRNQAEAALEKHRQTLRAAERAAQESQFRLRTSENQEQALVQRLNLLQKQLEQLLIQLDRRRTEESGIALLPLEQERQKALQFRQQQELALNEARQVYEALVGALKTQEEERMRREQKLEPTRQEVENKRLKEQLAAAAAAQFGQQLAEISGDLAQLDSLENLWRDQKIALQQLPTEIDSLKDQLNQLGPVNLAALQELKLVQERKGFLDAQTKDLAEAAATLETAIRRIDRETRSLLQETYDQVNQHFGALFPQLFGGGQARLVLSGEEILDAGVQVIAQPPGKRNSSIHLLSGGEKALTAISLIFAFFQLNPAPFCLLDEVDAPLDDANTERFCQLVKMMSEKTQFLYISHNKIAMEMAAQLVGITMTELGISQVVAVDVQQALARMQNSVVAGVGA